MTLGQKIKKLRADKGLTQKDLADQLHVAFQTVSKWESDTNEPDIATLKEIAKLFDVTLDSLVDENEVSTEEEKAAAPDSQEAVTKTIIIHQNEAHVCAKCGLDIPEDDLVSEDATKKERHGRHTRTVSIGQTYYHKHCLEEIKKERFKAAERARKIKAESSKKKCFGWGIAAGVVAFGIALTIFLFHMDVVHPALGVLFSLIIGYGLFSMLYCILSGSYLGEFFVWCASRSIRFPALIFSWDLDGFAWLIAMKILFAVLGFLFGVFIFLFAVAASSILGMISFPFILVHNIQTDYADAF